MASVSKFANYNNTVRQVQQARQLTVRPGMSLNAYSFMGGVSLIRNPEVEAQNKVRLAASNDAA